MMLLNYCGARCASRSDETASRFIVAPPATIQATPSDMALLPPAVMQSSFAQLPANETGAGMALTIDCNTARLP